MKQLPSDWITSGLIDFEYKKYILLAYLKQVKENFYRRRLYPFLSELIFHYNNLRLLQESKKIIQEGFPKEISGADFEKLEITYRKILEDDEFMSEIEDILRFAVPQLKTAMDQGKEVYEYTEQALEISPVGLTSIYTNEGYVFIKQVTKKDLNIYRYTITFFENSHEKYQGINFEFIEKREKSSFETPENIKVSLTKKFTDLPHPATYIVECKEKIPFTHTVLPVSKRLLVRYINNTSDQK